MKKRSALVIHWAIHNYYCSTSLFFEQSWF